MNDKILDFSGQNTGIALNKKLLLSLAASLIIYFLLLFLDPLAAYGEITSKALGFLIASVLFMCTSGVPLAIIAMLVATLGVMTGLFPWSTVSERLGASNFYQAFGMMVVAMGCEFTPFGKRLGYWILRKFGNKPIRLMLVISATCALLSCFLANAPTIILMSSIVNSMLLAMGEKPGESKMGKVLMLVVTMAVMVGGAGLMCGSPIGISSCLAYMTEAVGYDASPSFIQWACVCLPTLIICIVPMTYVYIRWFKVRSDEFSVLPRSYYDEKLKELGPMCSAEWRWLAILFGMLLCLLLGMKTAYAAILFAALTLFPGVGVANSKKVLTKIPWNPLIAICMLPLMSTIVGSSGIRDWLTVIFTPIFGNVSPLVFALICSFAMSFLMTVLVNSMQAAMALVMSVAAPICVSLGYNPTLLLLPAAMGASYMWVLGANQYVMMNKEYGWWEMKDTIVPGVISICIPTVISCFIALLLGPLFGMPVYL